MEHHYIHHVPRLPAAELPDGSIEPLRISTHRSTFRCRDPSERGLGGKLLDWDRTSDLAQIDVPTLVIGAQHDTMDPAHMEWMTSAVQHGRYLHCPDGSHLAMHDDYQTYADGLIDFIYDVDADRFEGISAGG